MEKGEEKNGEGRRCRRDKDWTGIEGKRGGGGRKRTRTARGRRPTTIKKKR